MSSVGTYFNKLSEYCQLDVSILYQSVNVTDLKLLSTKIDEKVLPDKMFNNIRNLNSIMISPLDTVYQSEYDILFEGECCIVPLYHRYDDKLVGHIIFHDKNFVVDDKTNLLLELLSLSIYVDLIENRENKCLEKNTDIVINFTKETKEKITSIITICYDLYSLCENNNKKQYQHLLENLRMFLSMVNNIIEYANLNSNLTNTEDRWCIPYNLFFDVKSVVKSDLKSHDIEFVIKTDQDLTIPIIIDNTLLMRILLICIFDLLSILKNHNTIYMNYKTIQNNVILNIYSENTKEDLKYTFSLVVASKLVKLMNGFFDIDDNKIQITIPFKDHEKTEDHIINEAKKILKNDTIIVAENSFEDRLLLYNQLTKLGFRPIITSHSEEILDIIRISSNEVKMAIIDIDYKSIIEDIKSKYPGISVFVLRKHQYEADESGVINKPTNIMDLFKKIKTLYE